MLADLVEHGFITGIWVGAIATLIIMLFVLGKDERKERKEEAFRKIASQEIAKSISGGNLYATEMQIEEMAKRIDEMFKKTKGETK